MSSVYSVRLASFYDPGSSGVAVVVPAGKVAIVTDLNFVANAAGTSCYLQFDGADILGAVAGASAGGSLAFGNWQGRFVLNPGEAISVLATAFVSGQLSGYLLTS